MIMQKCESIVKIPTNSQKHTLIMPLKYEKEQYIHMYLVCSSKQKVFLAEDSDHCNFSMMSAAGSNSLIFNTSIVPSSLALAIRGSSGT